MPRAKRGAHHDEMDQTDCGFKLDFNDHPPDHLYIPVRAGPVCRRCADQRPDDAVIDFLGLLAAVDFIRDMDHCGVV